MLPEGWKSSTIGEHVDLLSGFAFKSEDYISADDGIKLLRGDNVSQSRLRWRDVKRFPQPKAVELSKYQLQVGDFVIAMDRTWIPAGVKVCEVVAEDLPCLLVQRVARLRALSTIRQDLLRQYFAGHRFEQYVQSVQTETAVPHISPTDIRDFEIALPPISEQRRIADILSTWDQAISVQERLVANAHAQKKALMQTLLTGKKRLPGFKGEWKMKLFKHVVSVDQDSLGQNTPPDFEFRYISLSDVSSGSIANNLPSHTFSEAPSRARRKLKLGDILMATVRPNLQAFARVQSAQSDCIASTGFSVLSAKRDHSADYVYHYLFSEHITGQIDALVVGSSYPAINSADVANLAIHCPEKAEQDAIARVLNDSDETVISGETKLSILKREKSALMQQLLTGKRRVKVEAIEQ